MTVRATIQPTSLKEIIPGLIYTFIGLAGFIMLRVYPNALALIPPCLFKEFTGYPCPACGASRSGFYLAHFQILRALHSNPFFFMVFIGVFLWGVNSLAGLLFKKNMKIKVSAKEQRVIKWILILSLPASWLYLLLFQYFGRKPF